MKKLITIVLTLDHNLEDISKRLYKGDDPSKDTQIRAIRREAMDIADDSEFANSFSDFVKGSRLRTAEAQGMTGEDYINPDGTIAINKFPLKSEDFPFIDAIAKKSHIKKTYGLVF